MIKLFLSTFIVFIFFTLSFSQDITICSWNIANFGKSKSTDEIEIIAKTIKDFDIIAIQEVSTSPAGSQAVAQLLDVLNRMGNKWDCTISNPTSGEGSEKYAYLWKTSKVKLLGKPWLEESVASTINREPFLAVFFSKADTFLLANFHAVPKSKNPAIEIEQLFSLDIKYEKYHLIMMGDFNSPSTSTCFQSLYSRDFLSAFKNQKTTLKMEPNEKGERFANAYDNFYFEKDEMIILKQGINDFSLEFSDLKSARQISDHIPIWACFTIIR